MKQFNWLWNEQTHGPDMTHSHFSWAEDSEFLCQQIYMPTFYIEFEDLEMRKLACYKKITWLTIFNHHKPIYLPICVEI